MKIFIDAEFKCHVSDDGTMTAIETDFFYDKSIAVIEGYRFIPAGEKWVRSDGEVFHGEMVTPWKDFDELDATQRKYEKERLSQYESLINELYSEVTS